MGECPNADRGNGFLVPVDTFFTPDEVRALAFEIASASRKHPFNAVLDWVRANVPYDYDINEFGYEDWWQYPVETVQRGEGDCEDTAFLVASLLQVLGYHTRVVTGMAPGGYHAWCEAEDGEGEWWLLETTTGHLFRLSSRAALGYEPDVIIDSAQGCDDANIHPY